VQETTERLRRWIGPGSPRAAVILGSGLGALVRAASEAESLPFREIPGFPSPTVPGHGGRLVFGRVEGRYVLLQLGRPHLYEGHSASVVAHPVRAYAGLGIKHLIVMNAAGCLRPEWRPPLLMLIADHLNLQFANPLIGPALAGEARFPDMSEPYDEALRAAAREVARQGRIPLREGTYAAMPGPHYETQAEVRMLARLGADAVGMSTVPEVLAARARGMRVLGVSSLSNLAAGLSPIPILHEDVLEAGRKLGAALETILRGVLTTIGPS